MRRCTKLLATGAIAIAVGAGALFGGALTESPSAGATAAVPAQAISEGALSEIGFGGTQTAVARLEAGLEQAPDDATALATLGLAYQLRWRETGDAGYLPRSEAALHRARHRQPA